ncbi:MAG: ATP-binding protein [Acidobacteriota bacterium]
MSTSTSSPPSKPRLLALGALLALTAVVVGLGALSISRKVRSFQPVGLEGEAVAGAFLVGWADPSTGLQAGDQILLVQGEQITSGAALRRALEARSVSEVMVLRGQKLEPVQYTLPPLDWDVSYLVLVLIGGSYIFIGLYTLVRRQNRQVALFHLWCLASGAFCLWTAVPPFDALDRLLVVLEDIALLVLPPLTLHFFLTFPHRLSRRRFVPFLYLPAAVLAAFQFDLMLASGRYISGGLDARKIVLFNRLELFALVAFAFAAVGALCLRLANSTQWEEKRQIGWIALGTTAGYLPLLFLNLIPTSFGFDLPEAVDTLAVLPLFLVPLSFAYAILRYRLWDIGIILRDVAAYTLTLLLGALGFSLLNLLIQRGIPEDFNVARNVTTIAGSLLIAGLLVPAKQSIGGALQRFHYGGRFGRRRALSSFGQELLHERDLDRLSSGLLQELEETMELELTNLLLVEKRMLVPVRPEIGADTGALRIDSVPQSLWKQEYLSLQPEAFADQPSEPETRLYALGYRYVFPLTLRGRHIGLAAVGYKDGQVPLSSDDLPLIRQLLNQSVLAIENAQLLEQSRKQLREVLELKQFNEEIIESSPAGIAVLDDLQRVLTCNQAFGDIFDADADALAGRQLTELLPADQIPATPQDLIRISLEGDPPRELRVRIADFQGSGAEAHHVIVAHDETEHVAMQRALEEKDRMAALGLVAAGVAHEVNTPLTGISSYAQMLLNDTDEADPRYEVLKKVERQTFRASAIVNNLLQFARRKSPLAEVLALDGVVEEVCELLAVRLRSSQVQVQWIARPAPEWVVKANEGELYQVFVNLFTNAIDAMTGDGIRANGAVSLRASTEGEMLVLEIEDNGPGIPSDQVDAIFDPFFSTKLAQGGTGLGLAISQQIVRRHDGDLIAVDRGRDFSKGALFRLTLPLAVGPATAPGQAITEETL